MAKGAMPPRRPDRRAAVAAVAGLALLGGASLSTRGAVAFLCGRPHVGRMPGCAASAAPLSQAEADEIKRVFQSVDGDGDGSLDATEFAQALDSVGPPVDQLSNEQRIEMFSAADVDDSGRMDYEEFQTWVRRARDCVTTFRTADADDNGQIDFREWQRMVAALTQVPVARDELDDVFDKLDVDGDGLVSFAEFARWMDTPKRPGGLRGVVTRVKNFFNKR